jgi:hypothetical protein
MSYQLFRDMCGATYPMWYQQMLAWFTRRQQNSKVVKQERASVKVVGLVHLCDECKGSYAACY